MDALAGLLPFDARERLAVLLTDEDAATLKHLARSGMPTRRCWPAGPTGIPEARPGQGARRSPPVLHPRVQ
ncbi:hypothetical protein DA075_18375 [Methylobacterium currus]|uniref:Uncharacterized protein n=1 Tax=Methylobacterium currus TaxID=2051553 RepID=A0A2R4WM62_9HYPH|nr:hypothetical protein DA075_18375 [Methylobacterium currus]